MSDRPLLSERLESWISFGEDDNYLMLSTSDYVGGLLPMVATKLGVIHTKFSEIVID